MSSVPYVPTSIVLLGERGALGRQNACILPCLCDHDACTYDRQLLQAYPLMLAPSCVLGPELAALGVALSKKLYAVPDSGATVSLAMPYDWSA